MSSLWGWQSCLEGAFRACEVLLLGGWLHETVRLSASCALTLFAHVCVRNSLETPTPVLVLGAKVLDKSENPWVPRDLEEVLGPFQGLSGGAA